MLLKSTDSPDLYSNNTPYDFYVHLPRPLTLTGHWSASLLETSLFSNKAKNGSIYLHKSIRRHDCGG